jgi:beta-lactamase superfamily II metal-dependent hydrolase
MQFAENSYPVAPAPDELEVAVFGAGYGESVAVHVGGGKWLIVDSCVFPNTQIPASLQYLIDLGLQPNGSVVAIIPTHWDDDHVQGLSTIVAQCPNAVLVIPECLTSKDFMKFIELHMNPERNAHESGVTEIDRTFEICETQNRQMIFPHASTTIIASGVVQAPHGQAISVHTLSPSNYDELMGKLWIAQHLPLAFQPRKVAQNRDRNHLSTVVQVVVGQDSILLGGDLEERGDIKTGWSAIIANLGRPQFKSSVYKVAHHASSTGHHPGVWTDLLDAKPIALVAPWLLAGRFVPQANEAQTVINNTPYSYIASDAPAGRTPKIDRTVEKTIEENGIKYEKRQLRPGLIRTRKKVGAPKWKTETFGAALDLSAYASMVPATVPGTRSRRGTVARASGRTSPPKRPAGKK